jgi:signal peptidase II
MKRRLGRPTAVILFAAIVLVSLAVDRVTKILAVSALSGGQSIAFLPGILDFRLVYNTGAAFGFAQGQGATLVFVVVAVAVLVAIVGYVVFGKHHGVLEVCSLALIAAGAAGNAYDRLFGSGQVVDFIHTLFMDFPLFNVADSCITVGVILFILSLLLAHTGQGSGNAEA